MAANLYPADNMALLRIDIAHFRNLLSVKLSPIPAGFNIIYGENGSGKTSFLEAIYYLSLGRSFRSGVASRIINQNADKLSIFAHIDTESGQTVPVGIERYQHGEAKIRVSGQDVRSIAELADLTPVQLINTNCYNLLDTPGVRRKYLDWGAFYLSKDFMRVWRLFERALKQRNAALRNQLGPRELALWDEELIQHALALDQIRRQYVQSLLPLITQKASELLSIADLEIYYHSGWHDEANYRDILAQNIDKDRQAGFTQYGPHRADFKINVQGVPAKDILSRGQQKLFVCAMILAQGTLLTRYANKRSIYLVDDLPSELDVTSRSKLMSLLSRQEAQIFVTAVDHKMLDSFLIDKPTKMFHVEHGDMRTVMEHALE